LFAAVVAVIIACTAPASAVDRSIGANVPKPAAGGAPWSADDVRALDADLDALLARTRTLRGAHVGIIVETPAGRVLYASHAADTIMPASTFKLLVGSVALDRLGPAYRFETTLARLPADAASATDATERLVLRGGGDPLLGAADLRDAAAAAQRSGIAGPVDLLVDESHVAPSERRAPGWSVDDMLQDYAPIVNGLPFEENVLAASLDPAATIGGVPSIRLPKPFAPLALPVRSCPGGPTLLTFDVRAQTVATGHADTSDAAPGRCGEIVVTGDVPQGAVASVDIAVDAPEMLARLTLADALTGAGIAVATPAPSSAPLAGITDVPLAGDGAGTIVWDHRGEPLADLLADMWLPSDNLIAEELFHELDAAANHRPATAGGAAAVERAWLREIGVDPAALTIADGSGLSQYDRINPSVLAAILVHDWNGPHRDVVLDALPIAGARGDLRRFGLGTSAAGHVFAKTGSMMHVRGLAGYVASARHGAVVFALSVDDWLGNDDDLNAFRAAFCSRIVGG
jgi:D-alanyl-D-alanine carboxypeptidase/D-alanyl-D-alanine-endopeptidase (penicillin-binding protein 4)